MTTDINTKIVESVIPAMYDNKHAHVIIVVETYAETLREKAFSSSFFST